MTTVNISANQVKELRELTNAGMMECKKALVETNGDMQAAIEFLLKSGQAKAAKKQGRITAEGIISIKVSSDKRTSAILEINCETDFVARDSHFMEFVDKIGMLVLESQLEDVQQISALSYGDQKTVEQARQELVSIVGENVTIRRATIVRAAGIIGTYNHGGRIGTAVAVKTTKDDVAKDMAMQVAATNPSVIKPEDISKEELAKQKEIFMAQSENTGKPAEIIAKMIEGKLKKYAEEMSLTGQPYVKDPNVKVADYLKQNDAEVLSFVRFEVGEGIEKVATNFAEEVMAQVRGE